MIAVALLVQVVVAFTPTRTVLVVDAGSGAPVARAEVTNGAGHGMTGGAGAVRIALAPGDTVRVRRVGYRALAHVAAVADRARDDTVRLALHPVASRLPAVVTSGSRDARDAGRLGTARSVDEAREGGVSSTAQLLAELPYVSLRGARGEATLSIRGGRAEQVAVTLDGLSLVDPASGRADASDLPLVALGAVRARPGADGSAGSGAVAGTIAFSSGEGSVASVRAGAYGARDVEGATSLAAGEGRLRVGAAWHEARNDFPFVNSDGATGADSTESRVNSDESRMALFASGAWSAAQFMVLATSAERGMAGPMNVRIHDADRGRTDRLFVRGALAVGNWTVALGVRAQMLAYRSAATPSLDFSARTLAPDHDIAGDVGPLAVRAGAGVESGDATGMALPTRARAFLAAEQAWMVRGVRVTAGARIDAIERAGAEPSLSLAVEGTGPIAPYVRLGQAFRAPTLYDLYFASPGRLATRALDPERVVLDAEAGVRARIGGVDLGAAAFARDVRDAIVWFPGNFTWSPANVGLERVRGAEGEARISGPWYAASLWGSVTESTLDAAGFIVQTPYVPRVSGGASASVRAGTVGVTTTAHGLGRRAFAAAPSSPATELPAVLLADVAVHWHVTMARSNLLLTAAITNLGDARWESVRRFPAVGRSWSLALTFVP